MRVSCVTTEPPRSVFFFYFCMFVNMLFFSQSMPLHLISLVTLFFHVIFYNFKLICKCTVLLNPGREEEKPWWSWAVFSQSAGAGIRASIFNRCNDVTVRTREVPLAPQLCCCSYFWEVTRSCWNGKGCNNLQLPEEVLFTLIPLRIFVTRRTSTR